MILDISEKEFKQILNDKKLFLPIRWGGGDFKTTLEVLFDYYIGRVEENADLQKGSYDSVKVDKESIKQVCGRLLKAVESYLNGFPSKAYGYFEKAMWILMRNPLEVYEKSIFDIENQDDNLKLFRVTKVTDNKIYSRERMFHTLFNLRNRVLTSRYSIAGYPSLYLGTSLRLCCEEIHLNPHQDFALASVFKIERVPEYSNTEIRIIELGVKPQDFFYEQDNNGNKRNIERFLLRQKSIRGSYLLWYPLIAACSYIRVNKQDPFAAEYIIPQLLMQWVRCEMGEKRTEYDQLIGIRYFSCASEKASEMGFDYVFPTSGIPKSSNLPYCAVLSKAFKLSNPVYIQEFEDFCECERYLKNLKELKHIGS